MAKIYLALAVAAAIIIAGLLACLASTLSEGLNATAVLVAIPSWAMQFGNKDAPITVIEFFDPLCSYCAIEHRNMEVIRRFIDEGRLRLVLIPVPIHGGPSLAIVNALQCAKSDALEILNEWYNAYIEYNSGGSKERLNAALAKLLAYSCNKTLTLDQIESALKAFERIGIPVKDIPVFVVIKDGRAYVFSGARSWLARHFIKAVLSYQ